MNIRVDRLCDQNILIYFAHGKGVYSIIGGIHDLITIPLETDYTLPYGLIYANEPTAATKKFIAAVKKIRKSKHIL